MEFAPGILPPAAGLTTCAWTCRKPIRCSFTPPRSLRAAVLGLATALVAPAFPVLAPTAQAHATPDSFADLAERLLPGVVNISSSQLLTAQNRGGPDFPVFPPGSPFEQFFKDFMERNRPQGGQNTPEPPRRAQSLGSGFIIDPAGIVVTNNHVIEGADEITVILQDNTNLKATLIGRDERSDIAVLKSVTPRQAAAVGAVRR